MMSLFSLAVDTGASVSLVSESAFSALKIKLPHVPVTLQSSPVTFSSVQGANLTVLGTVTLKSPWHPMLSHLKLIFISLRGLA